MTPTKTRHPAWICFFASLFFFYTFLEMTVFNSLGADLLQEFSISSAQLGNIAAAYFYTLTILLLPSGILLDRFPVRKIILGALGISVIGTILFSFSQTYTEAFWCRLFSGIGGGFSFIACLRVAASLFPPKRLPIVIGLITTLAFLGGIIAQTPLTWLVLQIGWHHGMQIVACIGVLIWLINFIYTKDLPVVVSSTPAARLSIASAVRQALCQIQTWLGGLYVALMNLPVVILGASWGSIYLQQTHHLSAMQASYITSMLFIGILIGSPVIGWVFTKIRVKKLPMMLGAVILFLVSLSLFFTGALSPLYLGISFFVIGFFSGAQCFGYAVVIENNSPAITATASSIGSMLIMIVTAGSKVLFGSLLSVGWSGAVVDSMPMYSAHEFSVAMLLLPVAFVVSLLLAIFMKLKS